MIYDHSNDTRPCPFTAVAKESNPDDAKHLAASFASGHGDWAETFACMRVLRRAQVTRPRGVYGYLGGCHFEAWDSDGQDDGDCVRLNELAHNYLDSLTND